MSLAWERSVTVRLAAVAGFDSLCKATCLPLWASTFYRNAKEKSARAMSQTRPLVRLNV